MAALMALFLVLDLALKVGPVNHIFFIADCIAWLIVLERKFLPGCGRVA